MSVDPAVPRLRPAGLGLLKPPAVPSGDLFSWTVIEALGDPAAGAPPALGAVGVCGDRARAMRHMEQALLDAPVRAFGLLHKVCIGWTGGYRYDRLLAKMRVDRRIRAVLVEEWEPTSTVDPAGDLFAEITRFAGRNAA
ncbi:hypothetical protein [Thermomonospora cellulosilytica]|uniref:Uncharacterized protein n=1 Tax=Thermomonospora cellulosilytica TaxID=1411118 RepID=A0A7W3MVV2_9ACTN|nr:hypothetical protein [Thermomonospora cellulosilytica]MBA9002823.1 hypothetical protein [Thermomonospora cellulosilytica]